MGVYKRGGVWWINYWDNEGERQWESAETTSKKEAQKLLVKRQAAVCEGRFDKQQIKPSPMLSEFADEYLRMYSKQNKKPSSYKRDQGLIKNLSRFFEGKRLRDINPMLIRHYRQKRLEVDKRTPATVNRECGALKGLFTFAIQCKRAFHNPVKEVRALREDNEIVNPITDDDETLLIKHAAPHLQNLIICGADTGMRRQEMFDLTWDKVDMAGHTIRVENTKNDKLKVVYLSNRLMGVLHRLKKESKSEYVFMSPKTGGKLTKVDTAWRRANQRAGLQHKHYRFHDLRGTFITRLVEEGKSTLEIKPLTGHTTTRMLERYSRPGEQSGREAIAALDRRRARKVIDFEEHSS